MPAWIDSHCHLDAPEFAPDAADVRLRAAQAGVRLCVLPAVSADHFESVRTRARCQGDGYALGIHPLWVPRATEDDLHRLDQALTRWRDDPHLVAVGEIGLDFWVPALCTPALRERQQRFYLAQLAMARHHGLPVILHVRRSADRLLHGLRRVRGPQAGGAPPWQGIAHAFNGSLQQALAFRSLGLRLGFGGAFTHARALQLRRLARTLPLEALVLETDAPDMPPAWLYVPAAERAAGRPQARNEPAELPRVAAELAALRSLPLPLLAQAAWDNTLAALPGLARLLPVAGPPHAVRPAGGSPYTAAAPTESPSCPATATKPVD